MSIDTTNSPPQDDETPAATSDNGHNGAERTTGTQGRPNDDRGHQRAETLTREQYAGAMRADGPPIQQDSPDSLQLRNGGGSDGRADTEEADRETPGPHDRERDGDRVVVPESEPDRGAPVAEPLTREEYADAIRGNGPDDGDHERPSEPGAGQDRDASTTAAAVTHFHGEFKGQQLNLYTDGTRWAAADTPRPRDTITEKGEITDRLPTGEELVDSADEDSSRLERLRRDVYEQSDDETDVLEKDANIFHDVFSHPPTSSYEGTPAQPHIFATQHSGIDAGTVATAIFTFGLVIDRAAQWAVGYYNKHAKGR